MVDHDEIRRHYDRPGLLEAILAGLASLGKDVERLQPDDLAAVDEFHLLGRDATEQLAQLAAPQPGERVLDVGSGIGGAARYLASRYGCRVTGVDLSESYCEVARELSRRVGLAEAVEFHAGSALDLPVPDASFDLAWTQHVQMNISDKRRFYGEIARAVAPGGRLAFWDIFAGEGALRLPVPWASEAHQSSLIAPDAARGLLRELGFVEIAWSDATDSVRSWLQEMAARAASGAPRALGTHLIMGKAAAERLGNVRSNLEEGRLRVVRAALRAPG